MKKKVALLLALVMVLSLLPMNVFGTGATYTPGVGNAPGALNVTVSFGNFTAAQRAGLVANPGEPGYYLEFMLTTAVFTATPAAIAAGNGVGNPIGTNVMRYDFSGATDADLPTTDVVIPFGVNTGGNVQVRLVPRGNAPGVGGHLLLNQAIGSVTGGGQIGLTIHPGIVRNPLQEPDRRAHTFEVTVRIDQLHGQANTFGPAAATRLSLELLNGANNNLSFTARNFLEYPYNGNAPSGDIAVGTGSRIRVSDESQLFWTDVDERIDNPSALFAMAPGAVGDGHLSTLHLNRHGMETWLAFSAEGLRQLNEVLVYHNIPDTGGHEVRRISGVLVLEISYIVAHVNEARINVSRVGRFGMPGDEARVPLVQNQLLTFPAHPHGIDVNGASPVQFTSALWLPNVTITERRPLSFHTEWRPGGSLVTNVANPVQHIRLMGPVGYIWNVPGANAPGSNGWSDTNPPSGSAGGGLQPVTNFYVRANSNVWTGAGISNSAIGSGFVALPDVRVSSEIDRATGRPILYLTVPIPALSLRTFPQTEIRTSLDLRNLVLVPMREGVTGEVHIDVHFGYMQGAAAGAWDVESWTPQFHQDFTQHFAATPRHNVIQRVLESRRSDPVPPVLGTRDRIDVVLGTSADANSGNLWNQVRDARNWSTDFLMRRWIALTPGATAFPAGPVGETSAELRIRVLGVFGVAYGDVPRDAQNNVLLLPGLGTGQTATARPTNPFLNLQIEDILVGWTPEGFVQGAGQQAGWFNRSVTGQTWYGTKHVGTRAEASLRLTTGDVPTLISGRRNLPATDWTQGGAQHPSSDHSATNPFTQHRTARVLIEELVPGAFDTGWGSGVVELAVTTGAGTDDGVRLVHAAWRIWSNVGGEAGGRTTGGVGYNHSWHHVPFVDEDYHPSVALPGVPIMRGNEVRLFVPRNPAITARRTLEVYLFVSIEAGFADLYDNEPIMVSVNGSAVQTLAMDNRSAVIAYVEDPITVDMVGPVVEIAVGQVMSPVELTRIADVVITETAVGRLTRGTTFTLNVEALPIPVLGHHALVGSQFIADTSGLELRVTQVGTGQTAHMQFEVIRESQHHPAVMTFVNNYVMGTFLPGIVYGISINGTPVAANPAPAGIHNNAIAQNTARGLGGRGNFDSVPYFREIVRFVEFVYEGLPPGVGEPPGQGGGGGNTTGSGGGAAVTSRSLVLFNGMPGIQSSDGFVAQPAIMYQFVPGNYAQKAMNTRVFADFINGDIQWNPYNQTVSIIGTHANGSQVTVEVSVANPTARVNGNPVDISTAAGHPQFAGRVSPVIVNDRTFVPVRFLAESFGINPVWNAANATTTFHIAN
jgi:hypothetical protein